MKKFLIVLGVIIVVLIMVASSFIGTRNQLVTAEEGVNGAWAQVQTVYQRRADLIPNLVETVKGYASHERETLQAVVDARSRVGQISQQAVTQITEDPQALEKFQAAQSQLTGALSRLLVVAEQYPNLKADQTFLSLQSQIEGTENRIAVERRRYNEVVQSYNTMIRRFPANIVASLSGFERKAFFNADAGAEQAPKVKF